MTVAIEPHRGGETILAETAGTVVSEQPAACQVLVADDDPDLRAIFSKVLRHAGFTVDVAEDGNRAMSYLLQQMPDLLVLDHNMPGPTGLEILSFVRVQQENLQVKIILVTGNHLVELSPEAALADIVMIKPISTIDLIQLADRLRPRVIGSGS